MKADLAILDIALLIISLALSANGGVPILPVAVSLMSSCLSGLTLLGSSAELYYQGPSFSMQAGTLLLSGPITALTILPIFYKLNELSLYKYLEKRFGNLVKYTVSIICMVQSIFHHAITIYLPAMALESVFDISKYYSILLIGSVCIIYSSFGGIKAVIWTDFYQAGLMYASVLTVGIVGTYEAGGLTETYRLLKGGGRLNFDGFFDMSLTTRHTLFAMATGGVLKSIYLTGVNQVQIQRALSLGSLRKAQWTFALSSVFCALISLLSSYMGFVIYAAYRSCDPYLNGEIPKRDSIILHYIAHRMAHLPGVRGIFIAGILSATFSCLSSFANSMSALTLEDFIRPLVRRCKNGKEIKASTAMWLSKVLVCFFGLSCTLMAFGIEKARSRLLQMTATMTGAICVPFLAVFTLGIFTRFTNSWGVFAGLAVSISIGSYFTVFQTFIAESLEPTMIVYYNDQCAKVFNMTAEPSSLLKPQELSTLIRAEDIFSLRPEEEPSFWRTSYMLFAAIQYGITLLVAATVSLITGGWNQEVDDAYLVSAMKHKDNENLMVNPPAGAKSSFIDRDKSASAMKTKLESCLKERCGHTLYY